MESRRPQSRRRSIRAVASLTIFLLAVLTACGGDPAAESSESTQSEAGLLPEPEGKTQYPTQWTTWGGDMELPERPKRIAAIGFSTNLDMLQALGVTPVYSHTEEEAFPWRDQEWFDKIETVDPGTRRDPINFESLLEAKPDLIVSFLSLTDAKEFERLSSIAPVADYEKAGSEKFDWRGAQLQLGELLDLGDSAQTIVTDADTRIKEVAAANSQFAGKTITMAVNYGGDTGLEYYTPTGSAAEGIFLELGFAPNPLGQEFVGQASVSAENVDKLDADVLIVSYWYQDSPEDQTQEKTEQSGVFKQLRPVVAGRYVSVVDQKDPTMAIVNGKESATAAATWVMRRGASTLSVPWAVDVIANEWLADITF